MQDKFKKWFFEKIKKYKKLSLVRVRAWFGIQEYLRTYPWMCPCKYTGGVVTIIWISYTEVVARKKKLTKKRTANAVMWWCRAVAILGGIRHLWIAMKNPTKISKNCKSYKIFQYAHAYIVWMLIIGHSNRVRLWIRLAFLSKKDVNCHRYEHCNLLIVKSIIMAQQWTLDIWKYFKSHYLIYGPVVEYPRDILLISHFNKYPSC